jgi:hypothetical protein
MPDNYQCTHCGRDWPCGCYSGRIHAKTEAECDSLRQQLAERDAEIRDLKSYVTKLRGKTDPKAWTGIDAVTARAVVAEAEIEVLRETNRVEVKTAFAQGEIHGLGLATAAATKPLEEEIARLNEEVTKFQILDHRKEAAKGLWYEQATEAVAQVARLRTDNARLRDVVVKTIDVVDRLTYDVDNDPLPIEELNDTQRRINRLHDWLTGAVDSPEMPPSLAPEKEPKT